VLECGFDLDGSGKSVVAVSCERFSDYQFLNNDSAPCI